MLLSSGRQLKPYTKPEKAHGEKLYLEQEIDTELGFGEIIRRNKALQAVMKDVRTVATTDATVLLLGETGTDKEMVTRAIHRTSECCEAVLIRINCAAIPSGLLESELFGNERGAFTAASNRKIGRLELAYKGTLFLDEIGQIPVELQPKLLRVLQDQQFKQLQRQELSLADGPPTSARQPNVRSSPPSSVS